MLSLEVDDLENYDSKRNNVPKIEALKDRKNYLQLIILSYRNDFSNFSNPFEMWWFTLFGF